MVDDDASPIGNEDEDQDDMNDNAEVETDDADEWTNNRTMMLLFFSIRDEQAYLDYLLTRYLWCL